MGCASLANTSSATYQARVEMIIARPGLMVLRWLTTIEPSKAPMAKPAAR